MDLNNHIDRKNYNFIGKRLVFLLLVVVFTVFIFPSASFADNPIIKTEFTADPAVLVYGDKVYLYVGHDQANKNDNFFVLKEWNIYSSSNLQDWTLESSMSRQVFNWAINDSAWASQAIERNGKFYWYTTVLNGDPDDPGYAIGVAVSDSPAKGFTDAIGKPLISNSMTASPEFMGKQAWDDIDPTVFVDDDGQAYLYWGNTNLYYVKLKESMIEIDGEIKRVEIKGIPGAFTEGPWIFKKSDKYYLAFAMNYPELLGYAVSNSPTGPWKYEGPLMRSLTKGINDRSGSNTSHPAIIEYKDEWYIFYHTSALPTGGQYRRSVSLEKVVFNNDGTINPIIPTASGITGESQFIQSYSEDNRFVAYLNDSIKINELLKNRNNFMWYIVPGLASDGEGYVSFQAETQPGYYLKIQGDEVVLAKHDGSMRFNDEATFKIIEGLANENWLSYQSYREPELYLTNSGDGNLALSKVNSEELKINSTFRLAKSPNTSPIDQSGEQRQSVYLIFSLVVGITVIIFIVVNWKIRRRKQKI
ncbi:family 43 glycosylhydrolase [Aquibacillus salsiterrae]|uniref:Family 43 glycosylhydrolase n=1 Tax=Aquibacillus salsiterrae TaxID=2950439 RepID=A0A9X3WCD3_9BACI|nr:family 43 glycosylhydrolase [Aquibacillus salsiterrae]MDC3416862.1 family 43 glycosylhydrolase [Aquibacillus salsiterrae]